MKASPPASQTTVVWRSGTVWAAIGLASTGAVAVVVGWRQVATTVSVERQIDWLPLIITGASAMTLAMVLWVLAGRHAVVVRLERLATSLPTAPPTAPRPSAVPAPDLDQFVATDNMVRYHRPSCPLAAGKTTRPESRVAHAAAGREPCGICEP